MPIQRFMLGTKKRWYCRFGLLRVFVLLFAWLTLFPTSGRFPGDLADSST